MNNKKINLSKDMKYFYGDNAQGKTNIIESIFNGVWKIIRANKDKEMIMLSKIFKN